MRYKHSSTVTGTDLKFSECHAHQSYLPSLKKKKNNPTPKKPNSTKNQTRIVWNFRHLKKPKNPSDYSGFITLHHKASLICSRKLWLKVKKTFSL